MYYICWITTLPIGTISFIIWLIIILFNNSLWGYLDLDSSGLEILLKQTPLDYVFSIRPSESGSVNPNAVSEAGPVDSDNVSRNWSSEGEEPESGESRSAYPGSTWGDEEYDEEGEGEEEDPERAMVRRELAQEAKDIEAKLVSIARETYETEGIEDEIEKALEKSIAFINADSSDRCEHIKETEEDPKLRTRYLLSENRRLARESSRLEDRVCSHIVDLKNGSLVSAKGPLPPSHTPEESALEAGKASLSYTLEDRKSVV